MSRLWPSCLPSSSVCVLPCCAPVQVEVLARQVLNNPVEIQVRRNEMIGGGTCRAAWLAGVQAPPGRRPASQPTRHACKAPSLHGLRCALAPQQRMRCAHCPSLALARSAAAPW